MRYTTSIPFPDAVHLPGAEIVGGGGVRISSPPPPGCVILRPSPVHVLNTVGIPSLKIFRTDTSGRRVGPWGPSVNKPEFWLNSGLFQQRLALLDLSRSKQWRSHSSRTCTDRFIESQAPALAWGRAVAYRSSWLQFSLATSPRSHGIIATAAHSRAKIRTAGRQPAG